MTVDPSSIPPQYNPISGSELAQLCGKEVERILLEDCHLTPGVAYKLFRMQFHFALWVQGEYGEVAKTEMSLVMLERVKDFRGASEQSEQPVGSLPKPRVFSIEVDVGPNDAPDDLRREKGLEVPK